MEVKPGQIVRSRKGRDVTKWYVVLGIEQDRVLLVDGQKRSLAAPKPKNSRHIQPTNTVLDAKDLETDKQIKSALTVYESQAQARSLQGG